MEKPYVIKQKQKKVKPVKIASEGERNRREPGWNQSFSEYTLLYDFYF